MPIINVLTGWKSYLAAAGLFGLALYKVSTGDYPGAWTSLMAALAVFGVRQAIAVQAVATKQALAAVRGDRP